jgi:hypothetical protein
MTRHLEKHPAPDIQPASGAEDELLPLSVKIEVIDEAGSAGLA